MKSVREQFEEIWPVPEGIEWSDRHGQYMIKNVLGTLGLCLSYEAKLDVFTRCQETTAIHLGLIDELVQSLQWYVDEDEINEGQEGNEYWVDGKHEAEALLDRAKHIMEGKK